MRTKKVFQKSIPAVFLSAALAASTISCTNPAGSDKQGNSNAATNPTIPTEPTSPTTPAVTYETLADFGLSFCTVKDGTAPLLYSTKSLTDLRLNYAPETVLDSSTTKALRSRIMPRTISRAISTGKYSDGNLNYALFDGSIDVIASGADYVVQFGTDPNADKAKFHIETDSKNSLENIVTTQVNGSSSIRISNLSDYDRLAFVLESKYFNPLAIDIAQQTLDLMNDNYTRFVQKDASGLYISAHVFKDDKESVKRISINPLEGKLADEVSVNYDLNSNQDIVPNIIVGGKTSNLSVLEKLTTKKIYGAYIDINVGPYAVVSEILGPGSNKIGYLDIPECSRYILFVADANAFRVGDTFPISKKALTAEQLNNPKISSMKTYIQDW